MEPEDSDLAIPGLHFDVFGYTDGNDDVLAQTDDHCILLCRDWVVEPLALHLLRHARHICHRKLLERDPNAQNVLITPGYPSVRVLVIAWVTAIRWRYHG